MFMCTSCGGEQENGDFCMHCGASLSSNPPEGSRSADTLSAAGLTEDTMLTRFTTSMKIKPGTPPPHPRLWAVIGLLAVVGGLLVVVSIYLLFNALPLLGDGGFGIALGLFIILLLIVPLVFGCGLLYLARRLQQGDRLSRVLTVVTCAAVALASLLSGARDAGWVLAAILALGVILLLTIDPVVRAHFSGPDARYSSEPTPVVAARALMVVVAGCDVFVALGFFVLSVCRQLGRLGRGHSDRRHLRVRAEPAASSREHDSSCAHDGPGCRLLRPLTLRGARRAGCHPAGCIGPVHSVLALASQFVA